MTARAPLSSRRERPSSRTLRTWRRSPSASALPSAAHPCAASTTEASLTATPPALLMSNEAAGAWMKDGEEEEARAVQRRRERRWGGFAFTRA